MRPTAMTWPYALAAYGLQAVSISSVGVVAHTWAEKI
jgi:hypothetical protein